MEVTINSDKTSEKFNEDVWRALWAEAGTRDGYDVTNNDMYDGGKITVSHFTIVSPAKLIAALKNP